MLYSPKSAAAVRAIREALAKGTSRVRADVFKIANDDALREEVRQQRVQEGNAWVAVEGSRARAEAGRVVEEGVSAAKRYDPDIVRRRAVLDDPERAHALRGALAGLSAADLGGFADDAHDRGDEVLAFAVAKAVELHPNIAGNAELRAVGERLARPLSAEAQVAQLDVIAARAELAMLEHADLPAALGQRPDMMKLNTAMDEAGINSDEHLAKIYARVGLSITAPNTISSERAA